MFGVTGGGDTAWILVMNPYTYLALSLLNVIETTHPLWFPGRFKELLFPLDWLKRIFLLGGNSFLKHSREIWQSVEYSLVENLRWIQFYLVFTRLTVFNILGQFFSELRRKRSKWSSPCIQSCTCWRGKCRKIDTQIAISAFITCALDSGETGASGKWEEAICMLRDCRIPRGSVTWAEPWRRGRGFEWIVIPGKRQQKWATMAWGDEEDEGETEA